MKKRKYRKRAKANGSKKSCKNVKLEDATNKKYLVDLPNEVVVKQIFPYLDGVDVLNLSQAGDSRLRSLALGYIDGKAIK